LGDLLCAIPAMRALRRAVPDGRLTLIAMPETADRMNRFGDLVDDVVAFPGHPRLPERQPNWSAIPGFYAAMRSHHFDLAVQLHGSGEIVNPIVAAFDPARILAYRPANGDAVGPGTFLEWREAEREADRWLRLLRSAGFAVDGLGLEFPVLDRDRRELAAVTGDLVGRRYAVIHPGATAPERRWATSAWARLADGLARLGLTVVLTGTTGERALSADIGRRMASPFVDLTGATSLGALAALIDGAALVGCPDTGVSHLAAALGVPSIVVFRSTDPARWAPADARIHRVLRDPDPVVALAEAGQLIAIGRRAA
jgi:ADP-heptose:LPS heptosyltransferase